MSARAASSAVPLQPHGSAPVTPEPVNETELHNKELQVSQDTFSTPSEEVETIELTQSQEDEAEASAQLQQEAEAADMAVSPLMDHAAPEETLPAAAASTEEPATQEPASRPSTATPATESRPSSALSGTSHRELAPPPTPPTERRPSSNSVLERVKAMEAKRNGK